MPRSSPHWYYDRLREKASPFGLAIIDRVEHLGLNLNTIRLRSGYSPQKFYSLIQPKEGIRLDYVPDIIRMANFLEMDPIPLIQLFFHIEERRMAALMLYLSVDSRLPQRDQEVLARMVAAYPIPEERRSEKRRMETERKKVRGTHTNKERPG